MCRNVVDDSIAVLKLIPDWFLTSKMIKKLFTALYGDFFCMSEDEKKGIEPVFTEELQKCALVVYAIGILKHFSS